MGIKFNDGAHWYDCRSEPSPAHDADLRVARKQLLYPSITTILKDEKNEWLERWKTNELLAAAANTYKQPHESVEQYCQRIYDMSLDKATTAADFGKEIHDAIEKYPALPSNESIIPWIQKFGGWHDCNVEAPLFREKILFDHALGLAGRCDFIGRGKGLFEGQIIVPDWKTQGVKKDDKGRKKAMFYDSWPKQLAFYAISYAKENQLIEIPTCISVVIDSTEPEDPFIKVWTKEEIMSSYEDVVIAAYRWFKKRSYWPQPTGKFTINPSIEIPC